jgi:pyridoxamine 5'-phosphate oxidase
MKPIAELRKEYTLAGLLEEDADRDPIQQFDRWMREATATMDPQLFEPTAMTLSTATPDGLPAARIVLLKHYDADGFCFFTNYQSHKGQELADNPRAALTIFWPPLERQVRIVGPVTKVSAGESDEYWASRPRGSQLGAWVSEQSRPLTHRRSLEEALVQLTRRYEGKPIPRPPHWGGYRLRPTSIEFWQGRENRLHDRLRYRHTPTGQWMIERLAP